MSAARARVAAAVRVDVDVVVEDARWSSVDGLDDLEALITRAACHAYAGAGETGPASVAVALLDDAAVAVLNRQFRGKDKPTNVLSFPANDMANDPEPGASRSLGDIALAYDTIVAEAREIGICVRDHVVHLAVHGVLHLLGFDHENDADAERMETLETKVLAGMGIADPHAAV